LLNKEKLEVGVIINQ